MKFTEEKLEKAFTQLLGQEGFPHHLGIMITRITSSSSKRVAISFCT